MTNPIGRIRPDEDTLLGMTMRAVQTLTDEVGGLRTDVRELRQGQIDMREQITAVAAQNRAYYGKKFDAFESRLSHVEGEYDEITGVTSQRELEKSARTYRARAAARELEAKELEAAAVEAKALEAALEARIKRWKQIALGGVAVAAIVGPALMQGAKAIGLLK